MKNFYIIKEVFENYESHYLQLSITNQVKFVDRKTYKDTKKVLDNRLTTEDKLIASKENCEIQLFRQINE